LAVEQRYELVERPETRSAGLDEARNALIDSDTVRIREAERSIDMDVNVDPARRQAKTLQIDRWRAGHNIRLTDALDAAVRNRDVGDPVDAERGVDDPRPFQDESASCIHVISPSLQEIGPGALRQNLRAEHHRWRSKGYAEPAPQTAPRCCWRLIGTSNPPH
jgi:hypothetical protein